MTDRKAALTLAQLHAAGLLPPVWVPPPEVRDQRALVAQRYKMVRLSSQAKNRLQSLLHRHRIAAPEDLDLYAESTRPWWEELPISAIERVRMRCDLDTLAFAAEQRRQLEACIAELAAADPRVPLLIQLPGIGLISGCSLIKARGRQHQGTAVLGTASAPQQILENSCYGGINIYSGKIYGSQTWEISTIFSNSVQSYPCLVSSIIGSCNCRSRAAVPCAESSSRGSKQLRVFFFQNFTFLKSISNVERCFISVFCCFLSSGVCFVQFSITSSTSCIMTSDFDSLERSRIISTTIVKCQGRTTACKLA